MYLHTCGKRGKGTVRLSHPSHIIYCSRAVESVEKGRRLFHPYHRFFAMTNCGKRGKGTVRLFHPYHSIRQGTALRLFDGYFIDFLFMPILKLSYVHLFIDGTLFFYYLERKIFSAFRFVVEVVLCIALGCALLNAFEFVYHC